MCNCGSDCGGCQNHGTIVVDGETVEIFNDVFDLFYESEYVVIHTERKDDIKELKGVTTLPKAFVGEVSYCGNFLNEDENEIIEFNDKKYIRVEVSATEDSEVPTYLLMSEFDRDLYQVYVKTKNGYHLASDKLFPTKAEAETYLKFNFGVEGGN